MAKIDRYPLLKSSSSTEQNNKKLTHLEPSFHNLPVFVLNTVYTDIYLKQTRSWATGARVFIEKWTFTFTVHLWLCCWILIRFLTKNSMRSLFYIYLYIINQGPPCGFYCAQQKHQLRDLQFQVRSDKVRMILLNKRGIYNLWSRTIYMYMYLYWGIFLINIKLWCFWVHKDKIDYCSQDVFFLFSYYNFTCREAGLHNKESSALCLTYNLSKDTQILA